MRRECGTLCTHVRKSRPDIGPRTSCSSSFTSFSSFTLLCAQRDKGKSLLHVRARTVREPECSHSYLQRLDPAPAARSPLPTPVSGDAQERVVLLSAEENHLHHLRPPAPPPPPPAPLSPPQPECLCPNSSASILYIFLVLGYFQENPQRLKCGESLVSEVFTTTASTVCVCVCVSRSICLHTKS